MIAQAMNIPHLDVGNMLRQAAAANTAAGLRAKRMMDAGLLVTDDIVDRIVEERLSEPDCSRGYLLDGFPRNIQQAKWLQSLLSDRGEEVAHVVVLNAPKAALEECVLHRWLAENGDEYTSNYIAFRRPKSLPPGAKPVCNPRDMKHCNMIDDQTGAPLYRRSDDNLETLHMRLEFYHKQTEPILTLFRDALVNVNGSQPQAKVWADIQKGLRIGPFASFTEVYETRVPMAAGLVFVAIVSASVGALLVRYSRRNFQGSRVTTC